MKRSFIIVGVTVLLILATVRLFFKTQNEFEGERESYIRNLNYDFSAKVDSMIVLNSKNGRGFLVMKLEDRKLNGLLEDSLNSRLQNHEWMRLLFFDGSGNAQVFMENISKYQLGDSVCLDTNSDRFSIYRDKKVILESTVTRIAKQKVSWEKWLKKQ